MFETWRRNSAINIGSCDFEFLIGNPGCKSYDTKTDSDKTGAKFFYFISFRFSPSDRINLHFKRLDRIVEKEEKELRVEKNLS